MVIGVTFGYDGTPGVCVALTHADLDALRDGRLVNVMTEAGVTVALLSAPDEASLLARMREGAGMWLDTRPEEQRHG